MAIVTGVAIDKVDDEYECFNCGFPVGENDDQCPNCNYIFENTDDYGNDSGYLDHYEELKKLKELMDDKIITKAEFEKEKKKILGD